MKSIIEQASSIIKAIEKAWNQAEKPKEFSIKIFEQEERNFFGMSTKPAKIGIFFGGDKSMHHERSVTSKPRQIKECRPSFTAPSHKASESSARVQGSGKTATEHNRPTESKPVDKTTKQASPAHKSQQSQAKPRTQASPSIKSSGEHSKTTEKKVEKKQEKTPSVKTESENKTPRVQAAWNDTMITTAHTWLKHTLSLMGLPAINFASEVAGKNLKLTFNAPLIADPVQEKQLFRSFAHLIMSSLRNQYKQEIKNLKVVLIRPE
jgi:predicted RNA-binding protein Jag